MLPWQPKGGGIQHLPSPRHKGVRTLFCAEQDVGQQPLTDGKDQPERRLETELSQIDRTTCQRSQQVLQFLLSQGEKTQGQKQLKSQPLHGETQPDQRSQKPGEGPDQILGGSAEQHQIDAVNHREEQG